MRSHQHTKPNYYPSSLSREFGRMLMPGRQANAADYRYGFNGMEKDAEVSGSGNSYTTLFRQYDPRLGRWKSLDPLMAKFPWASPYMGMNNNPIIFSDPLGLFGSRKEAREYKKSHGIKGRIQQNNDGIFSINDRKNGFSYFKGSVQTSLTGKDGVTRGSLVTVPKNYIGEHDAALLSQNIYAYSTAGFGFTAFGIKSPAKGYHLLEVYNSSTGFTAGLYVNKKADSYIVSYAGTNQALDWITGNIPQAMGGLSIQYFQALSIAIRYSKKYKNIAFIGHSLGGGLATLAALYTNSPAITYNAAGLSIETLISFGLAGQPVNKIHAYVIEGEILNKTLSIISQGAMGNVHLLKSTLPKQNVFEKIYYIESSPGELNSVKLHDICKSPIISTGLN